MAGKPKYDVPDDAGLLELAEQFNGSALAIAKSLNPSPSRPTVDYWYSKLSGRLGYDVLAKYRAVEKMEQRPQPEPEDEISREEILEAENKELRSSLRKARKMDVQAERLLETLAQAVQTTPSMLPKVKPPKTTPGPRNTLIAPLSDTHSGEIVDLEAMDGINEYNWSIMEARVAAWVEKIISHAEHYTDPIQKLIVPGVGDMLSGNIHEELETTNEFPIVEQCWKFSLTFAEAITRLAQFFPEVIVLGVPGNHPRTKKAQAAKNVYDNFDWLMYQTAGLRLAHVPNVSCEFTKAGQHVYEIAGKNFFIWHGDGIRSSMPGVPWGGVMRRVNEIKKDYANRGILLDYFILGHFHQANVVQNVFMNGSVKGSDEWVKKNFGAGEPARQLLINFSETHGRVTGVHYLDLQDAT